MAKILVVEDEKLLNEAYELVLKRAGYDVLTAFNGEEAVAICKETTPDLILLDLRMPKMDGVAFLQKMDVKKTMPKTKIIIFSNYDNHDEIDAAFKHGAFKYILKAWSSPKELIKVVEESLGQKAGSKV